MKAQGADKKRSDSTPRYTRIEHTADIGIRVQGGTLEELFRNAALALFDLIADRAAVRPKETVRIEAEGIDRETLLVAWLGELLYKFNVQGFAFHDCAIDRLEEKRVIGTARGEPLDPERHAPEEEIKSVTYHQLYVKQLPSGELEAQIIFDV